MAESRHKSMLKTNFVQLPVGMYIARLTEALEGQSTVLSAAPSVGKVQGSIDFFHSEGDHANNQLVATHQAIIVRVRDKAATLLLTSSLPENVAKPKIKFDKIAALDQKVKKTNPKNSKETLAAVAEKLQKLKQQSKQATVAKAPKAINETPQSQSQSGGVSDKGNTLGQVVLVGHVEWKGDVRANAGAWLGDPKSKARIEGFAIAWQNKPAGVDLAYSCQVKNMGKTPLALSGSYVGTRRKALPITALTLTLVGINASNYTLKAHAIFADGEAQAMLSGVECQGVTGNEQLVGLNVEVLKKSALTDNDKAIKTPAPKPVEDAQWTLHSV